MMNTELIKAYQESQLPPETIDVDDWADKYRFMNEKTGEKWRTSRVAVARGPMKAVTEPGVRTITVMTATQILKTELILNAVGYFMDKDPCPILAVYPKEGGAKKFSHTRLKQMIKATPVLRGLVTETKTKDASDTTLYKEFPGGFISIVSARNPDDLAALPIRIVVLDEIDKFEDSSGSKNGGEGDPVDLAEERMSKYSTNCLSIRACSPTIKNLSKIETSYLSSDQRKPFVPCPHCQHKQILYWANVHWDKDTSGKALPKTARYYCIKCGCGWSEAERLRGLQSLNDIQLWRQQAKFTCCDIEHNPATWDADKDSLWDSRGRAKCTKCGKHGPNNHAGFWANKIYSPFRPLADMVRKWVLAQGNVEKLKMFINTQLAETFEEFGQQIDDANFLMKRVEMYDSEMPKGVGLLTAGVDVQDNRIEVEVIGWGKDEESWSLNHIILPGDPALPDVWNDLDRELLRPYRRHDGRLSHIAATAVDMQGHHTEMALQFCRYRIERRVWAIRGMGGDGRAYPVWPHNPSRSSKSQLIYYNIGVDSAKNTVFARLLLEKQGAGYCHFPLGREKDYFDQMIAERRVPKRRGTRTYYAWENTAKARNESFDMRVYGYAALCGLQSMGLDINLCIAEETFIMAPSFSLAEDLNEPVKPAPVNEGPPEKQKPAPAPTKRIVKSNFMDR